MTRRGNYSSGDDFVLEYGELRFTFNERDFGERCEQAARKVGFVSGQLSTDESEDLVNLVVNGEVQDPASALGEHVNDCWPELVGPAERSLVHWLRRLIFRGAWLDQRVKEGELDVAFEPDTQTFSYIQPERDGEPIELAPEPWGGGGRSSWLPSRRGGGSPTRRGNPAGGAFAAPALGAAMRKLLALPLAALTFLLLSPPARAGTYPMAQCQSTPARALSDGWIVYGGASIYNTCGGDTGFGLWIAELGYDTSGGMSIVVPASRPHVTIQRIETDMNVAYELNQRSFVRWFAGGQIIFDRELTGWAESLITRTPRDASRDFTLDVYCSTANGPVNCRFSDLHRVVVLSWLTFTLAESADPSARAGGGSRLAPGGRHGTESLAFTAGDEDSGVKSVNVKLGGAVVGSYDFSASCDYRD